jgi:RNA polymerase sigma-70 factor, ECF subfamily
MAGDKAILRFAGRRGAKGGPNGSARALLLAAIDRAGEGDPNAFHLLYVRYADDVCGYIQHIVPDRRQAEHVTQDVFTKLMDQLKANQRDERSFVTWALRAAEDAALEHVGAPQPAGDDARTSDDVG